MKNVWKGDYLRYDGLLVHVVDTLENIDTGELFVLCRYNAPKQQHHYLISKNSFLETAEINGRKVPKYRRFSESKMLSEADAERAFTRSGEYPPAQAIKGKREMPPRNGDLFLIRAKDLCESYLHDMRVLRKGAADSEEYIQAKGNIQFLHSCLEDELKEYAGYFRERFVEGYSIRKYAAAHGLNRGSVDYIQKKFFTALAEKLKNCREIEFCE